MDRRLLTVLTVGVIGLGSVVVGFVVPSAPALISSHMRGLVRVWIIRYRAHNGASRLAYIDLPAWYGPRDDPMLPLVISPHGRGATPAANSARWGNLPAWGRFAVVNPEGQGRRLRLYSWGDPGQITDLAAMPLFVTRALPWLRVDRRRIYAVGASMGGQEALLLLARDPALLAGVVAFDAPTDLARRYRDFSRLRCDRNCAETGALGERVRQLARFEIGGSPRIVPRAYALRSPISYARQIAFSRVPLELWWSRRDRVVVDSTDQSGRLYRLIKRLNPAAPVDQVVGRWQHTAEMDTKTGLPAALLSLGLLPLRPVAGSGYRAVLASRGLAVATNPHAKAATGLFPRERRAAPVLRARPTRDQEGAYPWPLRPFDQQHPIRGGFGDPRTLFYLSGSSSPGAAGRFSFHNGVDIVGRPGTPVYPVVSGLVEQARPDQIVIAADHEREFQYWHLHAAVVAGARVRALRTVLGTIRPEWNHVHFSESDRDRLVNPLLHLAPYRDPTPPIVGSVLFRGRYGRPLSPRSLHGRIWIMAAAYDRPWPAVPGAWHGFPLAPALLSWHVTASTGRTAIPNVVPVDFRHHLPPEYEFWRIYERGSYQNFPVVGLHYYFRTPGDYLYQLTPNGLDTGRLTPGSYVITITATDMGGNQGSRSELIRIQPQTRRPGPKSHQLATLRRPTAHSRPGGERSRKVQRPGGQPHLLGAMNA